MWEIDTYYVVVGTHCLLAQVNCIYLVIVKIGEKCLSRAQIRKIPACKGNHFDLNSILGPHEIEKSNITDKNGSLGYRINSNFIFV